MTTKTESKRRAPQRPFYKTSIGKPEPGSEGDKRFMSWMCDPSGCAPYQKPMFTENVYWRIFRIMAEFIEGFEFLSNLRREITFFGSARSEPQSPYYKMAHELGRLCAEGGYTVITGGGPGIMEAGNKGAFDGGGESVGLDIELPHEQRRNQFVTRAIGFHYFFTRKVMLSASAQAYVFFPGGFGTLDEATEMIALIQTGKTPQNIPCIFMGRDFWEPFLKWIKEYLLEKNGFIESKDLNIIHIVDTPEEALAIINKTTERELS